MEPSATQDVRDPGSAHRWAEELQPPDEVDDEIRELVDGLGNLDESVRSFFVEPPHPGCDCDRGDKEVRCGLSKRPGCAPPEALGSPAARQAG